MCPEHLFRASGDIRNSWGSWFGNLASLAPYQDETHPISQPGCWAYPDMLEVGNAGLTATEARSHFSLWCMLSAPLLIATTNC